MSHKKQLLLDEVKGQIDQFGSFVIMRYLGLNANALNKFRTEIAALGGDVEIVRKRILVKAAQNAGVELDVESLQGHVGLVYAGTDPFETAKVVFKYTQETKEAIQVIGGRFEGQLYSAADVEKLSKLPSKDEMRAQLLGTLEAPAASTLAVMVAAISSVVYCLDNKSKQGE